jgi:hypothetical protein
MTRRSLVLEARFDTEPATWRDRLLPALQPLVTAVAPQTMFTCSPGGRVSRGRRFKWAQVEDSASMATTGDIALNTYDGDAPSTIKLCLRHNPAIDLRFQPPASLFAAIERERPSWDGVLPAMLSFLQFAASAPGVLHGGITLLDNLAQAAIEVTGTSTDIDKQAPGFIRRHEHDWRLNKQELGSSCRRLYWKTLLGPTLATAAGGAADAAGGRRARLTRGRRLADVPGDARPAARLARPGVPGGDHVAGAAGCGRTRSRTRSTPRASRPRSGQLPVGKSFDAFLTLLHELVVTVEAEHAILGAWPTYAMARSDTGLTRMLLDTPAGDINLGLPLDFDAQRALVAEHSDRVGHAYARHPRWGTYLHAGHLAAIGGVEKIVAEVAPAVIQPIGALTYVQLTDSIDTALTPEAGAKRRALEALMAPILVGAPSLRTVQATTR